jgi:ubiquinone/menaquinone biosynthesis C-methylase UbiE
MWLTAWSPFSEIEVEHRSQQLLSFGSLMRKVGRSDLAGWSILDVGCGRGRLLRSFLDSGADAKDLFGVDLNENYVEEAKRISPGIQFATANGITLEFPDASFDLVTQYVVFSSIALPELRQQLAGEMWRVLKPGGYIFWWDMRHMAAAAGGHDKSLDARLLFPVNPLEEKIVGMRPAPDECLRPLRGLRRIVSPIINKLGYPQTHVATLFQKPDAS